MCLEEMSLRLQRVGCQGLATGDHVYLETINPKSVVQKP